MTIITFSDLQGNILKRLLPVIVLGLFASTATLAQTASIAPTPAALTEANLNTSALTLTLGMGETFIDATLPVDSFVLVGAPAGTSIPSVTYVDPTTATIDLNFNYTDFDSDVSFSINIHAGELTMTASGVLGSTSVTVQALQETAVINDPGLNEVALDGQTVMVTLNEETFINPGSMGSGNFTLNGAPAGLTVAGFIGTPTSTQAELDLQFIPGDFDIDYNSFSVTINQSVLTQSNTDLTTNTITISHAAEAASMSDPGLNETDLLSGQSVTITLANESFDNPLEAGNFNLVNYPTGLSITGVTRNSATSATVDLVFAGDFDTDYTDFHITISAADLVQTSSGVLVPDNRLTITAVNEVPSALLEADPALDEYSLDGRTVTITLDQESFSNPGSLVPGNFMPVNAPAGVGILSISGTPTPTSVVLVLEYDFTDFDVNYNDFRISIDDIVLNQSATDLVTSPLTITYGLEPVVTNVSIPNETMRIGSVVDVTITVEDDEGNEFVLQPGGVIGGYPLTDAIRIDATTYQSSFTVNEGGLDYTASQDIHVNDILFMNGDIPGNLYTLQYISQDTDPIDANRPVIQYIYTNNVGPQNIGSEIFFWIQADENGLTFADTSEVNEKPVSDPSIEITESGGGRYRLRYVVMEGDNNVAQGLLPVSMVALDNAGNGSLPRSLDPNNVSIDADRPVITSALITSSDNDISVGETITIVVNADQPGYRNDDANTWINGVSVEPDHLTFADLGDNSYLFSYTVQADDGAVARGELAIHIVFMDALPFSNTNAAFTDLNPNNVQILTSRPSASISGPPEICFGDSARITIILGGTAPWIMDISDGTTTTQHTSSVSPYSFWVHPTVSTQYTVTRVIDGTENENTGAGVADITVNPLPVVQIQNLQGLYDIESPAVVLQYSPTGGTFTGPGISASPWTFDPEAAGISPEGSPHEIEYTYTDPQTTCTASDIREVIVVSESGFIAFEKDYACFNDAEFLIIGTNVAGSTGSLRVQPTPPSGAFTDLGNDTAILRPELYNLDANLNITVYYTFRDQADQELTVQRDLLIEYLEEAVIDFIPDVEICHNENPIPLSGNYSSGYTFSSPGTGVVTDSAGNYYFNPALVNLALGSPDTNLVVYEYTSSRQCRVRDSVELLVFEAPDAGFIVEEPCIALDGGGPVQFFSRSDTGASVGWRWNFGDPESGFINNWSSLENPTHHYEDTGSYTITLNVTIGNCDDQIVKTIDILASPDADFIWSSDCLSEDDPTLLTGQETVHAPDTVSSWAWEIDSAGVVLFSSDSSGSRISYDFPSIGTYHIGYEIRTAAGCTDSIGKTLYMSPTILLSPDNIYMEDFELADHGWISGAENGHNSWTDDVVNPDKFPVNAASGTRAWYTDRPSTPTEENSWVLSPCFSFSDLERPMVSLEYKRSLHRDKDGAALQYTTDHGDTWHNVGDVDDGGLKWYNSTIITPDIGYEDESTGWTGDLLPVPVEDDLWSEAAHGIDVLVGQPEVRFRVAFGALEVPRTETNDGFAFDKFTIKERTRLSVLEYFTNANTSKCADTDTTIMEIMNQVPADVIDIQYHAASTQADEFYNDNPVPANNRGTVYGITGIPYAILDGGILTEELGHPMKYNFSPSDDPNVEDIRMRSLMDPDFKLTITNVQYGNSLRFSIEMEALRDLALKERTLYAVVLQRRVADPDYYGTNGITVFRQVARKMLPDAGGYYLGPKAWVRGESEDVELTYESPFFPLIEDSISIVVFMQDEETMEILQAATKPAYVRSVFRATETLERVMIYPNPAREVVHVFFEESPLEERQFTLYDLSGKVVVTDVIEPWQQTFTRSVGELDQGLYILEIRSGDNKRVVYRGKLLHY